MHLVSIENVADWIIQHRKNKIFKDYSREEIINELQWALDNQCLLVDIENDSINGVLVAERRLHVKRLLTTKAGIAGKLSLVIRKLYPNCKITADRRGKFKEYKNPDRAIELLLK